VKNINFLDLLKSVTSRWLWLVMAMIAGGLLAWGVTSFLDPLYEANAVFTVTIDYTQTGALTDIEEDQAMRGVGDIIFSDEVVSAALTALNSAGMDLSREEFFEDAIFDREEFRWAIRYRDADPVVARQVVTAWQEQADAILQDSLEHARMAASFQEVLTGLELCLQRGTQAGGGAAECTLQNLDGILAAISDTSALITGELAQSRGLFSALAVSLSDKADLPAQPVRYQTGMLVLSGMLTGLLAAIFLLAVRFSREQNPKHE